MQIKCSKICHSFCSSGLDIVELCSSIPIHVVEVVIFGRPAFLRDGEGFDLFSYGKSDPLRDVEELFNK